MSTLADSVGRSLPDGDEALRTAMVEALRSGGALRTDRVAAALLAVPRHVFAPEVPLAEAYEPERALVTKRNEYGLAVSSVSAARIQAQMLEQADVLPGMRVLEIGSGGYNAALIAELVGPEGEVVTVDIDPLEDGLALLSMKPEAWSFRISLRTVLNKIR